jgi:cephalosporin-C deacetylase-like acetyl esterase
MRVRAGKSDAVYALGERVTFLLEGNVQSDPAPRQLSCTVRWDGGPSAVREEIRDAAYPIEIHVPSPKPGFVRLVVEKEAAGSPPVRIEAAAAVAPERIQPSLPVPDDFDGFWEGQVLILAAHLPAVEERHHHTNEHAAVSSVRIPMPRGGDLFGWLMVPNAASSQRTRVPAVVLYHGAGVYGLAPDNGLEWAARGLMTFSVNPHPIPNDLPEARYDELRNGELADYRTRGRNDRSTIYFLDMFLRASRAVEYLSNRVEWDGKHLIAVGHSQGGGQALAAAALNRKVTALAVSCPTNCDHTGPLVGRAACWPMLVETRNGAPDPVQAEASRYYDGVNFASRIGVPAFFSVAFLDDVCPPTGVYAAYNRLRGLRSVHHEIEASHVHTETAKAATARWVDAYLAGESVR